MKGKRCKVCAGTMMEHNLPNERMSFSWCLTINLLTAGLVMSGSHSGFAMSYCSSKKIYEELKIA